MVNLTVTWRNLTGRHLVGQFDALALQHTPGTQPCILQLVGPLRPGKPPAVDMIEARQVEKIEVTGVRRMVVPLTVNLQGVVTAEDRVKAALDVLSDAEQLIAYKYLFNLGVRIAHCSPYFVKEALRREQQAVATP